MTVKEINPRILTLEYRQEKGDKDYGSCLWAQFMFNLGRYELSITSDCGNYAYKWVETTKSESFLELMARCDKGYILGKLYGEPDIFDYDKTKERFYDAYTEDEEKEMLDDIFLDMEIYGQPETGEGFIKEFDSLDEDNYFQGSWEFIKYVYPSDALKIVDVFDTAIRPYIKKILKERGMVSN